MADAIAGSVRDGAAGRRAWTICSNGPLVDMLSSNLEAACGRAAKAKGPVPMRRLHLAVAACDRRITDYVSRRVSRRTARFLNLISWAGDARVLLCAGVVYRLSAHRVDRRNRADHVLAVIATTTVLHHGVKRLVAQERPDRVMQRRRRRRVIGRPFDAFPSGHAMHAGAIASFIAGSQALPSALAWGAASLIAVARIGLLAHWTSGAVIGFAAGVVVERIWRGRGIGPAALADRIERARRRDR